MSLTIANDVQTVLSVAALGSDNVLTIANASAPFNNPPTPVVDSVLTIVDDKAAPSAVEIIRYSAIADNGDGTSSITISERGSEGTTALDWPANSIVYQSVTAAILAALEQVHASNVVASNLPSDGFVLSYNAGEFRWVDQNTEAFDPNFVGTLSPLMWFDVKQETFVDSQSVGSLADFGSHAVTLDQVTESKKPVYTQSIDGLVFDHTAGSFLQTGGASPNIPLPYTVILVADIRSKQIGQVLFDGEQSANRAALGTSGSTSDDFSMWNGAVGAGLDWQPVGRKSVWVAEFQATQTKLFHNGVEIDGGASGSNSFQGLSIGGRFSDERFMSMSLHELAVLGSALSIEDKVVTVRNLRDKWGIEKASITAFDPVHWYDLAQETLTDQQSIQDWIDHGSAAVNLSAISDPQRPVYNQALNALVFDHSAESFMRTASSPVLTQPYTIILVGEIVSSINNQLIFDGEQSSNRAVFDSLSTGPDMWAGSLLTASGEPLAQPMAVWALVYNGSHSKMYRGKTLLAEGFVGSQSSQGFSLAGRYNNAAGRFASINMRELAKIPVALLPADVNEITDGLTAKWGL